MAPSLRQAATALASLATLASAGTIAVTGAGPANVQPRLEIRTLEQNPDMWNLYMLAMSEFKAMDQSDPASFYGVAAIHGVPNEPWDGVVSSGGVDGYGVGYGSHITNIFPMWHRAFVIYLEQRFLESAMSVAEKFQGDDHSRYVEAARNLRFPFWDWAMAVPEGQAVLPESMTNSTVSVNTPTGQQEIPNPLLQYDMKPLNTTGFIWSPWQHWNETLRYPNTNADDAVSNQQSAIATVAADAPKLRNRLFELFSSCNDYRGFGNSNSDGAQYCSDSLEAIHNNIHSDMGGLGANGVSAGHMTVLPLAAFDPSFFLHHANIDRLLAMWQGMYPGSFEMNSTNPQGTYYWPANYHADADTFLAPFHKDTMGGQHTSNTVRDWTMYGYTYPEFVDGDKSAAGLRTKFNALYNPQNPSTNATPVSSSSSLSLPSSSSTAAPKADAVGGVRGFGGMPFFDGPANMGAAVSSATNDLNNVMSTASSDVSGALSSATGLVGGVVNGLTKDSTSDDSSKALMGGVSSDVSSAVGSVASPVSSAVSGMASSISSAPKAMLSSVGSSLNATDLLTNSTSSSLINKLMSANGSTTTWTAQVECQPHIMNGSYNIYVFMGAPASENPSTWATDKNLCGTHANVGSPGMHHNSTSFGSIPLTNSVAQQVASGVIPSVRRIHVVPLLKNQITFRVQAAGGLAMHPSEVPGLKIGVASAQLQLPSSADMFPKMLTPWLTHTAITLGKAGGLQPGQSSIFSSLLQGNSSSPASANKPASSSGTAVSGAVSATAATAASAASSMPTGMLHHGAPYGNGTYTAPRPSGTGVAQPSGAPMLPPSPPAPVAANNPSPAATIAPVAPSAPAATQSYSPKAAAAPAQGVNSFVVAAVVAVAALCVM